MEPYNTFPVTHDVQASNDEHCEQLSLHLLHVPLEVFLKCPSPQSLTHVFPFFNKNPEAHD